MSLSITSIAPSTFDDGRSVTLTGSGFGAAQGTVQIGGQSQPVTAWADTSITFITTRGSQSPGACRVDVVPTATGAVVAGIVASGWGQSVNAGGTLTIPAGASVFFDALLTTSNTGANVFRELGYHWDFGYATPTTPGSWAYSSQPKGNEIGGPLAAHVYETPGTYTASVRAQDAVGNYSDAFVTIVVEDPDTYWTTGGRSTVHHTNTAAMPTWANNTRYQFDRGSDYSAATKTAITEKSVIALTATGTGAKPILPDLTIESSTTTTRSWSNRIIIDGIEGSFSMPMCLSYVQINNSTITEGWFPGVSVGNRWNAAGTPSSGWYNPKFITAYESDFVSGAADYGMYTHASRFAVMGCAAHDTAQHNVRAASHFKTFFAHNRPYACGSTKANCTFRAEGVNVPDESHWDTYSEAEAASRYLIVAYCEVGSSADSSSNRAITIQPESTGSAEGVEDILVYGCTNSRAGGGNLALVCRRALERDNSFAAYGMDTTQGTDATPQEWFGPYYTEQSGQVDNVLIFDAPAAIVPSKAGT